MSDWSAGYVSDIDYTFGYYDELNPLRVKLAFLNNGLVSPDIRVACELGFGQGLSTNIHASASMIQWYGTDFNPSQAGLAQELAAAAGSNARLYDEAFEEFANRSDLPDFDFIGLHGIWSWISDENRRIIVEFVRRKLKVGGVLYTSYNTLPGWSTFAPLRHLMTEHAEVISSEGQGTISRVDKAIEFAESLLAVNPLFARAHPLAVERLKTLKNQNRHYLAHEYFNRDWHPMHFATLAHWLQPAKLQFACSAHYIDHVGSANLSSEQLNFILAIPDRMFRESVRDFMVNQSFRRDYWIKGLRNISPLERDEGLRQQKIILKNKRSEVSLKATGGQGEVTFSETVYNPILDCLSDNVPKSIGEIENEVKSKGILFTQVKEAIAILIGSGNVAPVQIEETVEARLKFTTRLNSHLFNKARTSGEINFCASPVTGGGVAVGRFPQLFILAIEQGLKNPGELSDFVWKIISSQGQKLIRDGNVLESVEQNMEELNRLADLFLTSQLPILKKLKIA